MREAPLSLHGQVLEYRGQTTLASEHHLATYRTRRLCLVILMGRMKMIKVPRSYGWEDLMANP